MPDPISDAGQTMHVERGRSRAARFGAALGGLMLLAGCAATTIKHGQHFNEGDIGQVQPGMSQDAVRNALGTPSTTSSVPGGNAFYYISSTKKESAFFKAEEVDRRVLAVYFDRTGSVQQVANYGLKDGKVFDYVARETPAHMRDRNFISRFFRGVGPKGKVFDEK